MDMYCSLRYALNFLVLLLVFLAQHVSASNQSITQQLSAQSQGIAPIEAKKTVYQTRKTTSRKPVSRNQPQSNHSRTASSSISDQSREKAGTSNFFGGRNAGNQTKTGENNVYVGTNAGNGVSVNGSNNTAIGFESGKGNAAGSTNTFLGYRADANFVGIQNATAIGAHAVVSASNALVLGNGSVNVGIGPSDPQNRLHILGGLPNTAGIRVSNLTATSRPTVQTDQFLTVNASGDIVLGSLEKTTRTDSLSQYWMLSSNNYLRNIRSQGLILGDKITRTPPGYRLFVQDGIMTEKLKVAIKSTADWSDYVFEEGFRLKPLGEVERFVKTHKHLPDVPTAEKIVQDGIDVAQMNALLLQKIEEMTLYLIQLEKSNKQLTRRNKQLSAITSQQQRDLQQLKQRQAALETRLLKANN